MSVRLVNTGRIDGHHWLNIFFITCITSVQNLHERDKSQLQITLSELGVC